MSFYLADWECEACGGVREALVERLEDGKAPWCAVLLCSSCGTDTQHNRRPVMGFAPYQGEKVREAPLRMSGGRFDTMGDKPVTKLPTPPPGCNTPEALKDFCRTPEYREAKAQRKADVHANRQKKIRQKMIDRGETTVRNSPLPGDDPEVHK